MVVQFAAFIKIHLLLWFLQQLITGKIDFWIN
jgi:hypothetical protein